jgi:acetyltransferase EpsM
MATAEPTAQAADPGSGLIGTPLILIGGGDHARVVIDAARSRAGQWSVQGYVAPQPSDIDPSVPYLGDDPTLAGRLVDLAPDRTPWLVIGFGGGAGATGLARRREIVERFGPAARWATVIHATAVVAPTAVVEPGAVVLAGAVVNVGAVVERHAIVNSGAIVEHDVVVGAGSHLAPGAVIGGGTRIGAGTFIGLGARIRDHVEIGAGALIGMGAVVVGDVASGDRVVGNPARTGAPRADGDPG